MACDFKKLVSTVIPTQRRIQSGTASRLSYGLRKDLVKLWIKERATILLLMALTVFVIEALPPVVREADR